MTDPHTDAAPERAAQPAQKAATDTAKAQKSTRGESAYFQPETDSRLGTAAAPEPASLASARQLMEAGKDVAEARREAALAGSDLWSRSFEPFYAFQSGMMRWFDDMWREAASGLHPAQPSRAFSVAPLLGLPPVDVKETADAYTLSVEVPGLSEQDVKVTVEADTLTVSGEKSQEQDEASTAYRLSERSGCLWASPTIAWTHRSAKGS